MQKIISFSKSVIIFLIILAVSQRGFGSSELYQFLLLVSICFVVLKFDKSHLSANSITIVFFFALWYFAPNVYLLWAILALLFFQTDEKWATLFFLICFLNESIFNRTIGIFEAFSYGLCCYLVCHYQPQYQNKTIAISALINLILIPLVFYFSSIDYCLEEYKNSADLYKSGIVFQQITGLDVCNTNEKPIIRHLAHNTKVKNQAKGIIIGEHSKTTSNDILKGGKWQQPTSWHHKQLVGNQYYLEAISVDGGLYTNIGANLKDSGSVLLAFNEGLKQIPLITKVNQTIYLHDSDYMTSRICNYQAHFLAELCHTGFRPIAIRLINCIALLVIILGIVFPTQNHFITLTGVGLLFIVSISLNLIPRKGEIRMVGKITNSHENNRFDGVPKSFIDQGFNYIIGNESCKILCVQTGNNAKWNNEEVIIAEPFAKIKLMENTYEVDEFPQSNIQEITDARFWKINGELTNTALLKVENVTLIATGSPAKQSWKNWLK